MRVFYNSVQVPITGFDGYLNMVPAFATPVALPAADGQKGGFGSMFITNIAPGWQIGIGARPEDDSYVSSGPLRQLSFVNSIATTRGGTHVTLIGDQVARHIADVLNEPKTKKKLGLA